MLVQRSTKITKNCMTIAAFSIQYNTTGATIGFQSRWLERVFKHFNQTFKRI